MFSCRIFTDVGPTKAKKYHIYTRDRVASVAESACCCEVGLSWFGIHCEMWDELTDPCGPQASASLIRYSLSSRSRVARELRDNAGHSAYLPESSQHQPTDSRDDWTVQLAFSSQHDLHAGRDSQMKLFDQIEAAYKMFEKSIATGASQRAGFEGIASCRDLAPI